MADARFEANLAWLLACFLLASLACSEHEAAREATVRPVKTFEVGATIGGFSREWPGRIEPTQNAEMSFNVAGDLVELPIEEGMAVERGQLLARLDAREFRARLDAEQAQYRFDKIEHERIAELVARDAAARADLDRQVRALGVSKAAVERAKKTLGDAKLIAPFSGTVAKQLVDNFQSVAAKQPVLILQDASRFEVVTHVSQRDYAAAKPGLTIAERNLRSEGRVHVVLDTHPHLRIPAQLKEMASVPDPITGTFEVTWSFDPPQDVMITPGMTATVLLGGLDIDAAVGVLVPIEAVVGSDEGGAHVWVLDRQTMAASRTLVEIAELRGDSVRVTAGLAGGELIATTGVHELREGLVVSRFEDIYGDVARARD